MNMTAMEFADNRLGTPIRLMTPADDTPRQEFFYRYVGGE